MTCSDVDDGVVNKPHVSDFKLRSVFTAAKPHPKIPVVSLKHIQPGPPQRQRSVKKLQSIQMPWKPVEKILRETPSVESAVEQNTPTLGNYAQTRPVTSNRSRRRN